MMERELTVRLGLILLKSPEFPDTTVQPDTVQHHQQRIRKPLLSSCNARTRRAHSRGRTRPRCRLCRNDQADRKWRRSGAEGRPPPHASTSGGYALADAGRGTRALQAYLGHRNIQHTVRFTGLAPDRFMILAGPLYDADFAELSTGMAQLGAGSGNVLFFNGL
jgi:hypothetical protein